MDASGDPPAPPIRVVVADVSDELFAELAEQIGREPDLRLVGRVAERTDLLLVAEAADVVLFAAPSARQLSGIGSHLLSEYPELKLLVLPTDGSSLAVYWRGLRRRRLGPPGGGRLAQRIREIHQLD